MLFKLILIHRNFKLRLWTWEMENVVQDLRNMNFPFTIKREKQNTQLDLYSSLHLFQAAFTSAN